MIVPHGYIDPMRRTFMSRIAAVLTGALVAVTAPGVALTHGYEHHQAAEEARHHSPPGVEQAHERDHPAVSAEHESESHGHPQLSYALSVRINPAAFPVDATPYIAPASIAFVGAVSMPATASVARAGPRSAAPLQPRAPPAS